MAEEALSQLLEEVLAIQSGEDTGIGDTVDEVSKIVNATSKLVESNARPEIAVRDAKVLSISTNVVTSCLVNIDANLKAFDMNLFADSILSYITVETPMDTNVTKDWARLHEITDTCCKHTISMDYMLGTFTPGELQPKKRKEKVTKQADGYGPVVKPQNVTVGEKQEDGIEESLHIIMKVLLSMYRRNNSKPVCYFKLIIDPESFSASVENMYHVSFLVKDGIVKLSLDDDSCPVISPAAKQYAVSGKKKPRGPEYDSNQCIMSLNMDLWKQIVEAFDITRARIPRKNKSATTSQS